MLDPDRPEAAPRPPDEGAAEPVIEPATDPTSEPAADATREPPIEASIEPAADATGEPPVEAPIEPQKVYELPTARKVVSSGLLLALASSSELRRASIYIGILILAAFGPAALAVLMTLGRLGDGAGDILGMLLFSPETLAETQPQVGGVLLVLMFVLIGGLVSYIAISVDAGIIAMAILGGRAADKPIRLWEAILRARQSFWRVTGAGFVVGLVSGIVQVVVTAVVGLFTQSVETSSVITAIVATIVVAPFAYVTAGIVLGDVGAIESLSRSWRLFRVRPWLAVIVVMFTLVTSAIQLFALSAGLDLILRASEALHVSVTEGALAFAAATVLMLAAISAFGSLLFTIGAIVSAPQVTGFLGLTFFSGGLDKARSPEPKAPKGFRWVTRPMLALVIGTTALIGLEIPAINSIEPAPVAAMLGFIRGKVLEQPEPWDAYGTPASRDDPPGDVTDGSAGGDVLLAEYAFLGDVPAWLLDDVFDCAGRQVACAGDAGDGAAFDGGAILFLERMAAPPEDGPPGLRAGVLLSVEGDALAPRSATEPYAAASRAILTSFGEEPALEVVRYSGGSFHPIESDARSAWLGADLYTLIPFSSYRSQPNGWDAITFVSSGSGPVTSRDWLRNDVAGRLRDWDFSATLFIDSYAFD